MKILLIVDMQNDFIDGSLGTKEAQSIVPKVMAKISRANNKLILFTKDTHDNNYLETQEGKKLPIKHCIKNTQGWCINKSVRTIWKGCKNHYNFSDTDIVNSTILKDSFGSTKLIEIIKELTKTTSIEEIELVGLCTDICVISNAMLLKSFFPEINIVVDSSCCAGVTPERHSNALKAMEACQIIVN